MKNLCTLRSMKVSLLICLLAPFTATTSTSLSAQPPADLDPTFGTGGKVIDGLTRANDSAYAVAVQPDGKIVAVCGSFALVRYKTDGSREPDRWQRFERSSAGGQG